MNKVSPIAEWGTLGILVFLVVAGMPMGFWLVRAFVSIFRELRGAIDALKTVIVALELKIVALEGGAETSAVARAAEHEKGAMRRHAELTSLITAQASLTRRAVTPAPPGRGSRPDGAE